MESTSTISLAATPTVILTAPPVATTNVTATTPLKLTPDLRKVRDSLAPETLMYYNCITSNEDKVNYLKAMRIQIKKEHEKGESLIQLLVDIIVFIIVICFIALNSKFKNSLYEVISFIISYFVQCIDIIVVLYNENGFSKRFILCLLFVLVPSFICGIVIGLMIRFGIEQTTAMALTGPGMLFTTWFSRHVKWIKYNASKS